MKKPFTQFALYIETREQFEALWSALNVPMDVVSKFSTSFTPCFSVKQALFECVDDVKREMEKK